MTQELKTVTGETYYLRIELSDDGIELTSSYLDKQELFENVEELAESVGEWFGFPLENNSGYKINSAKELADYLS